MSISINQFPQELSRIYFEWAKTKVTCLEIERHVDITNSNHATESSTTSNIKIVFVRSHYIYPFKNCPTPEVINNTVNISPGDPRVQKILHEALLNVRSEEDVLHFPDDKESLYGFELRFFSDEHALKQSLIKEKEQHHKQSKPRYSPCCFLCF